MIASQSQGGITNSYQLDAIMRPRERVQTGGSNPGTEVFHYAGSSDSPAWTAKGSSWTRNITGIGGELAAIQESTGESTLQLTNLHGDVVATASLSPSATKLTATFAFDEFGNPKQSGGQRFGWLGGRQRRTELPSGVIQMGVRSYVPSLGRFISTDPVAGGSATAYDYSNADPVNGLDLTGEDAMHKKEGPCRGRVHAYTNHHRYQPGGYGRVYVRWNIYCGANQVKVAAVSMHWEFIDKTAGQLIYREYLHPSQTPNEWKFNIGNFNNQDPLSFSCLQGHRYEWYIETLVWVESTKLASKLIGGLTYEGIFNLWAESICRS